MLVLGDFNMNILEKTCCRKWLDIVSSFSLTQLISEPTRVTETSSTLIDHVYTSNLSNIVESGVTKYALSDHYLVFAIRHRSMIGKQASRISIEFNDYSQFTDQHICEHFSGNSLDSVLCEKDVGSMFEKFNQMYRSIIRKLVTTKRQFVKTAYLPAWLDAEVKAHMQLRDSFKRQNKWPEYKKQRNFVTNLVKRKKKNVITELINTNKANT